MIDKCHYAFFLAKKPSVLLQSVIWLTSMLPLWLTHTLKCLFSRARIQARLHFGDTSYTKPDYQQVSEELAHTNTHTNTHTKWRTNHFQMFHGKAENFTAVRKNFTASQKNLTASRKCFTVCHYSCLFLGRSALPLRLRRMRLLASPSALERSQVRL